MSPLGQHPEQTSADNKRFGGLQGTPPGREPHGKSRDGNPGMEIQGWKYWMEILHGNWMESLHGNWMESLYHKL